MNELKIEYIDPNELTPYENNTRKHAPEDVEQIKQSILENGFDDPIGIWGDKNIIVEGHGRQIAALELHLDKVPVIRLDHLTDAQRRRYAIQHNRTAELSAWDFTALEEEIAALEIEGYDFSGLKFDFDADSSLSDSDQSHEDEKTDFKYFDDKEIEKAIIDDWQTYETAKQLAAQAIDKASAMFQFNRLCQGYDSG